MRTASAAYAEWLPGSLSWLLDVYDTWLTKGALDARLIWRTGNSRALVVEGPPGSGKTVAAAMLCAERWTVGSHWIRFDASSSMVRARCVFLIRTLAVAAHLMIDTGRKR